MSINRWIPNMTDKRFLTAVLPVLLFCMAVRAEKAPTQLDVLGIAMLQPTLPGGRTWFSQWGNGRERKLASGDRDPCDAEFIMRGDGQVCIDGRGIAAISGDCPRLYVYDEPRLKKWCNLEVTLYFRRIAESKEELSYRAFAIGVRSEHQDAADKIIRGDGRLKAPSFGAGYYGKMLYDGRMVFMKELIHSSQYGYSVNKPKEGDRHFWKTPDNSMPSGIWIGMKLIVRNTPTSTVRMELFRDMTDGRNGGTWEKIVEYTDAGGWTNPGLTKERCEKATPPGFRVIAVDEILLRPGTSVFIRNDGITQAECKKFSVREIAPLSTDKEGI